MHSKWSVKISWYPILEESFFSFWFDKYIGDTNLRGVEPNVYGITDLTRFPRHPSITNSFKKQYQNLSAYDYVRKTVLS